MARRAVAAGWLFVAAMALTIACDDDKGSSNDDRGKDPTAGASGNGDAGASSVSAPCLDEPGELPRPPSGRLPCDLLPPGFGR